MIFLFFLLIFFQSIIFSSNNDLVLNTEQFDALHNDIVAEKIPSCLVKDYMLSEDISMVENQFIIEQLYDVWENIKEKRTYENYQIIHVLKNLGQINTRTNQFIWNNTKFIPCFKSYFFEQYQPEKLIKLIINKENQFKAYQLSPKMYIALSLVDYACAGSLFYKFYKKTESNTKQKIGIMAYVLGEKIAYIPLALYLKKKNVFPNLVSGALGYFDYKNINTKIQIFFDKIEHSSFAKQIFDDLYSKEIVKPNSALYKDSFYKQRNDNEIIFESPAGNLVLDNMTVAEMNNLNLNIHVLTTNKDSEINIPFDYIINIDVPELNQNGYMFDLYKHEAKKIARTLLSIIKNKEKILVNITSQNIQQNFNTVPKHELSVILLYMLGFINDQHKIQSCDTFMSLDPARFFTVHPKNIQLTQYLKNFHKFMLYGDKTDSNKLMQDFLTAAKNLPAHPYQREILEILDPL